MLHKSATKYQFKFNINMIQKLEKGVLKHDTSILLQYSGKTEVTLLDSTKGITKHTF
jgi:hypothetical protein